MSLLSLAAASGALPTLDTVCFSDLPRSPPRTLEEQRQLLLGVINCALAIVSEHDLGEQEDHNSQSDEQEHFPNDRCRYHDRHHERDARDHHPQQ